MRNGTALSNVGLCNFSQVAGDATQMERIRAANGMRVWPSSLGHVADVAERFGLDLVDFHKFLRTTFQRALIHWQDTLQCSTCTNFQLFVPFGTCVLICQWGKTNKNEKPTAKNKTQNNNKSPQQEQPIKTQHKKERLATSPEFKVVASLF